MYQALYRKYRPKVFADVVGQEHITQTLKNEIAAGRFAHAYLFTGSRGTGKTTCSKILAKAVNCLNPVNGDPCLECEACRKIEDEAVMDVVEIDAASNNGVDNIRELREEANFTPAFCKYRVYIIDEAHMLSAGAFNALLKIMEEPPEHVIFVLATTEAHKILPTILSRCQRFDFKRISPETIAQQLDYIAMQEGIVLEADAARLLGVLADGGMRDAISMLDQCASVANQVDLQCVYRICSLASREYLHKLCGCIHSKDAGQAMEIISALYEDSKDLERLTQELVEYFRNLMIIKTLQQPQKILTVLPDEYEQMVANSDLFTMSALLKVLALLQDCAGRLARTANKRIELEMCFVKLCTPAMDTSLESIVSRLEDVEAKLRSGMTVQSEVAASPTPIQSAPQVAEVKPSLQPQAPAHRAVPPKPRQITAAEGQKQPPSNMAAAQQAENSGSPTQVKDWAEIIAELGKTDKPLAGILSGSRAIRVGRQISIITDNTFAAILLKQNDHKKAAENAVLRVLGESCVVQVGQAGEAEVKEEDPFAAVVQKAKAAGVPVEEEE